MKKSGTLPALLALLAFCLPVHPAESPGTQELIDRTAITEVMRKYVWSVDSLDADGYASVFTKDAEIHTNGTILKGHDQIRTVVTGMKNSQDKNRAEGGPVGALYHVISNETISFASPTEAIYRSYWQTMRKGTDNRYTTGGFGRSEDRLLKQRDGKWLIQSRKLSVYTD